LGKIRVLVLTIAVVALGTLALPSTADHGTRTIVGPLEAVADYSRPVDILGNIATDLAFWGNRAYMGAWDGFVIIDITNPASPQEVLNYQECDPQLLGRGNQGDVLVWEDILIRSWNSNTPGPPATPSTCDGQVVPVGFEGLHIFDISNEADPVLIGSVDLPLGSHTATLVPDLANNRLLVYNNASSANNPGIDIVQVPLDNPGGASLLRFEQAGRSCHDTAVFLGDVLKAVCAGGNGFTVFSLDPEDGGSLTNPAEMYTQTVQGVTTGHAAAFSYDGKMFAFGHEPGGGVDDRCDAGDREFERTQYFYDTESGEQIGRWILEPKQTEVVENCTVHNFNFIPTLSGRDIVVSGNYQAGTFAVDVTDPSNPTTIAYADPPPLDPNVLIDGGTWSTYWYNGYLYESDMTKGMHVFRLNVPDALPGHFRPEAFSNPQTQMESIRLGTCRGNDVSLRGTGGSETIKGTGGNDVIAGLGGSDRIAGRGGFDVVCGGGGNDKLKGNERADTLSGQAGRDLLSGGPGADKCIGGGGSDRAKGCQTEKKI
jgi:hypothetical protein